MSTRVNASNQIAEKIQFALREVIDARDRFRASRTQAVDDRFAQMDERLDSLKVRFDAIHGEIRSLSGRVGKRRSSNAGLPALLQIEAVRRS